MGFSATAPNVRGIEQDEAYPSDVLRNVSSAALYIPRKLADTGLWGVEKSAAVLSDPDFIERVEDLLYLYKDELLWFPIVAYTSGFRPEYGAGLYYRNEAFRHLFRYTVHDRDHYEMNLKLGHMARFQDVSVLTSVRGVLERDDDLRFYGIGGNPRQDPRNRFINQHSEQEYGTFTQERRKIEWDVKVIPSPNYGIGYLGYYQRKNFEPAGRDGNPLRDIFDLTRVPGFTHSPVTQIYNEVSVFMDRRINKDMLSPGTSANLYAGLSNGLRTDRSDLIRLGGDAAVMLPVRDAKRVLILRAIFDYVDAYHGEIPFTEYSHDLAFRGIASNQFIRNDKASLQPSFEYQWRLSEVLGAHVFVDYLSVGKTFTKLDWNHGAWATGVGLDVHWRDHEFGRVELAGGSTGFHATFSVNKPLKRNSRSKWR